MVEVAKDRLREKTLDLYTIDNLQNGSLESLMFSENSTFFGPELVFFISNTGFHQFNTRNSQINDILFFQNFAELSEGVKQSLKIVEFENGSQMDNKWFIIKLRKIDKKNIFLLLNVNLQNPKIIYKRFLKNCEDACFYGKIGVGCKNPLIIKLCENVRELEVEKANEEQELGETNQKILESFGGNNRIELKQSMLSLDQLAFFNDGTLLILQTIFKKIFLSTSNFKASEEAYSIEASELRLKSMVELGVKLSKDEDMIEIKFNREFGFLLTTKKLVVLNNELNIIKSVNVGDNPSIKFSGFWNNLLLFQDRNSVYYQSLANRGQSLTKVMSLGHESDKLLRVSQDRIYFAKYSKTRKGRTTVEVRCRKFASVDLLLQSYFTKIFLEVTKRSENLEKIDELRNSEFEESIVEVCRLFWFFNLSSETLNKCYKVGLGKVVKHCVDYNCNETIWDGLKFLKKISDFENFYKQVGFRDFDSEEQFIEFLKSGSRKSGLYSSYINKIGQILRFLGKEASSNIAKLISKARTDFGFLEENLKDLSNINILRESLETSLSLSQDSIKIDPPESLEKIKKPFGEKLYQFQTFETTHDGSKKNLPIFETETLQNLLGYELMEYTEATNLKDIGDSSEEKSDGSFDEEDECRKLLFLWRMHEVEEGEERVVDDITDRKIKGCFTEDSDLVWEDFKSEEDNPMELEDKWGKKVEVQKLGRVTKGYLKTMEKNWFGKKLEDVTFEIWFKSNKPDLGILFSDGKDKFICGFKKGKYFCLNDQKKVKIPKKVGQVKEQTWNHFAFSYSHQSKNLKLFNNGTLMKEEAGCEIDIKKWHKNHLRMLLEFSGEFSEIRFWRRLKTGLEIREYMGTPLSIVDEKAAGVKIKILTGDKKDEKMEENQFSGFGDFNFGLNTNGDDAGQWGGAESDEEGGKEEEDNNPFGVENVVEEKEEEQEGGKGADDGDDGDDEMNDFGTGFDFGENKGNDGQENWQVEEEGGEEDQAFKTDDPDMNNFDDGFGFGGGFGDKPDDEEKDNGGFGFGATEEEKVEGGDEENHEYQGDDPDLNNFDDAGFGFGDDQGFDNNEAGFGFEDNGEKGNSDKQVEEKKEEEANQEYKGDDPELNNFDFDGGFGFGDDNNDGGDRKQGGDDFGNGFDSGGFGFGDAPADVVEGVEGENAFGFGEKEEEVEEKEDSTPAFEIEMVEEGSEGSEEEEDESEDEAVFEIRDPSKIESIPNRPEEQEERAIDTPNAHKEAEEQQNEVQDQESKAEEAQQNDFGFGFEFKMGGEDSQEGQEQDLGNMDFGFDMTIPDEKALFSLEEFNIDLEDIPELDLSSIPSINNPEDVIKSADKVYLDLIKIIRYLITGDNFDYGISQIDDVFSQFGKILKIVKKAESGKRTQFLKTMKKIGQYKLLLISYAQALESYPEDIESAMNITHYCCSLDLEATDKCLLLYLVSKLLEKLDRKSALVDLVSLIKEKSYTDGLTDDQIEHYNEIIENMGEFRSDEIEDIGNVYDLAHSKRVYLWRNSDIKGSTISVYEEEVFLQEFCCRCNFCKCIFNNDRKKENDGKCLICKIGVLGKIK